MQERINLICTHKPVARLPEWEGEFTRSGYSFTTSFVQISVARERDIEVTKAWFLLLSCSWVGGGDKVGHRSLQCYHVETEN